MTKEKTKSSTSVQLVVGAASGIGRATALRLVEGGHRVVAVDTSKSGLEALARVARGSVFTTTLDVRDADATDACVDAIESEHGPIEGLVHAAGVLKQAPLHELAAEDLASILTTNTMGAFHVMRAASRGMVERRRGAIVCVSSNAGHVPRMTMGAYCASKAATSMLTRCFGLELAAFGIRCNVISPGSTDTPMLRSMLSASSDLSSVVEGNGSAYRLGIPLGRVASADDIAQTILFLLSERARHITMQDLRVDGGATL